MRENSVSLITFIFIYSLIGNLRSQEIQLSVDSLYFQSTGSAESFKIYNSDSEDLLINRIVSASNFFGYHLTVSSPDTTFQYFLFDSTLDDPFELMVSGNDSAEIRFDGIDPCPICNPSHLFDSFSDTLFLLNNSINDQRKELRLSGSFSTGIEVDQQNIQKSLTLLQNYPNPFNPITTIEYNLSLPAKVTLMVYNAIGEHVATLVNDEKQSGLNKIEWNAGDLTSGIYYYEIKSKNFHRTKLMVLLK